MVNGRSSLDNHCSVRVLRPRKVVVNDMQIEENPAKRSRRAISTIERGPASKVCFAAEVNVRNWKTNKIPSAPSVNSGSSSSVLSINAPMANVRSAPVVENREILNTLVATNALLAGQLVEKNNSFQELEQKYIRALEQSFRERLGKFKLQTKMDEQLKQIEGLEKKIEEYQNAAFCDDLIQLDGARKRNMDIFFIGYNIDYYIFIHFRHQHQQR